jgi:hypothetical protein
MPSIQSTDWLALKDRVDSLVTNPTLTRYDPGQLLTPPSDSSGPLPYLLISDVTNTPRRIGLSSRGAAGVDHIRSGTLMLTLYWPIAKAIDHVQLKEIAGSIAAHFPADVCMSYGASRLRTTQDADVLQPYVDGPSRVCVVRVFWSSM